MDRFECLVCGPVASRDPYSPFCPGCGEPLFVDVSGRPGKKALHDDRTLPIEKFSDFLPLETIDPALSLGEGATPLLRLDRLGASLGLAAVYAKNEAQNPTGSFKDRGTTVAVQKARAGLETFVLVKQGTSMTSLRAAAIFAPRLIKVEGDYGDLFRASLEVGKRLGISFMNSIDPYRMEGYKVTAFETFRDLGRRAPRYIFAPVSSGGHLLGLMRGFQDLEREGLITAYPTFVGVQAQGCAPLARAFETGLEKYERPAEVRTIAHAISNPTPPAGNAVLRLIRARGGILMAVTDEEMLEAQRELAAAEGLFCQPESATTLAGLKKLARAGKGLDGNGDAVLVLTGSGLKTPQLLESQPMDVRRVLLAKLEEALRSSL
jgi:threonine synthase